MTDKETRRPLAFVLIGDFSGWLARFEDYGGDGRVWAESACQDTPEEATVTALEDFLEDDECHQIIEPESFVKIGMMVGWVRESNLWSCRRELKLKCVEPR